MTSPMAGISRNLSCVLYVPDHVSGILLAVATLYVTDLGVEVVDTGRRRWVDTHWRTRQQLFPYWLQMGQNCQMKMAGNSSVEFDSSATSTQS
ncbi:hypothetical protein [Moorena sp. SIO4G3]|uniref:hypothetical protein n=1 Tax=Moorena sp. SIO4G3 TaxID=2607821 RepID=UPI0025F69943|nr:hypothetical protein [Moorena sp. SIO4G3]